MFEAVILAGGQGTRLKSVTGNLPKPMVEVNGDPFLYILMRRLVDNGCSKIILSLCYQADYIIERIKKDKPVDCDIDFVVEEFPLGTGGAIKLASLGIRKNKFLVLNGDTLSKVNYLSLMDFSNDTDLVISGVYVADVSRYGTLIVDKLNNVLSMLEKGVNGPGIINSGIYVIKTDLIKNFPLSSFSFENDFVKDFNGSFKAFVSNGYFIDIGIPEDYYKACQTIK
ncbi:MAG: nucleotidyltransferase family protein [Shewanella sp.]|jgi:D-glycero-alpha-D-manno-heptose 1-phosphate guanylyltransferase|uniref:nucleotidyltransferase family protein n=1 Tax=Shewanella sp. TaxID=50422 RepID=UPI0035678858